MPSSVRRTRSGDVSGVHVTRRTAKKQGGGQVPIALDELRDCVPSSGSSVETAEDFILIDTLNLIIEGIVVNLYVKQYNYNICYDKFDENDMMNVQMSTVVYEIAVDKTWYGEDVSGVTVTVEVTDDGFYFVPQDWTTLTAKKTRKVIMDSADREYAYYRDKMYVVDADTFAGQMSVLVSNIK